MTKQEIQQRVLKDGKPLDLDRFEWDENTKTFSSNEDGLVLDFGDIDGCTFITGYDCTFETGPYCTFETGFDCTFTTGYGCTFNTGSRCTFNTGSRCTFNTGSRCTFDTGSDCTFTTGEECVVVRRDIYEVIEIPEGKTIKLNGVGVKGYTTEKEQLSGKKVTVEIDGKKYTATID